MKPAPARAPSIALIAGEHSGDLLGGALIQALQTRIPNARFFGVTGERMQAAGCEAIGSIETLSVMGLAEVLRHLPRLFQFRSQLIDEILSRQPDLVIGIDAPDFNLGLEKRLRAQGLRTIHYVSPTVWAWRQGRVRTVAAAADRVLALFPFESRFYREHQIAVDFVGHPLADELSPQDAAEHRAQLEIPMDGPLVALLPGSRAGEVGPLGPRFVAAGNWLHQRMPDVRFVVPVAKPTLKPVLEDQLQAARFPERWHLLDGRARESMSAADLVLLASGTATLECLLLGRPMIVAYAVSPFTDFLLRGLGMLKVDKVSLPNLLCDEALVPEMLQQEADPTALGAQLFRYLQRPDLRQAQCAAFDRARSVLRMGAAERAADCVLQELERNGAA